MRRKMSPNRKSGGDLCVGRGSRPPGTLVPAAPRRQHTCAEVTRFHWRAPPDSPRRQEKGKHERRTTRRRMPLGPLSRPQYIFRVHRSASRGTCTSGCPPPAPPPSSPSRPQTPLTPSQGGRRKRFGQRPQIESNKKKGLFILFFDYLTAQGCHSTTHTHCLPLPQAPPRPRRPHNGARAERNDPVAEAGEPAAVEHASVPRGAAHGYGLLRTARLQQG